MLIVLGVVTASFVALGAANAPAATSSAPGEGAKAVGFIFVGPKDDFGYNQAAYQGSQAVKKAYPKLKILTAENVPEDDSAARVMEGMVSRGAKIIFATSYGHLDAAIKVAKAHPDVAVVQQGNFIAGSIPANAGTFFGTVYEPVYLAGIAAGLATKSNKLGYVYAFPISQTIDNIDAFELGAQSVNPKAETYTVNTSSWCDPAGQAEATKSLLGQGVDVITQHQDCTSTVIKTTEAAGKFTVGYHADASKLAPKGWVAGSQWSWGALYTDIVKTALAGDFTGSKYNANYRVGYKTGDNPFVQSKFGSMITAKDKQMIEDAKAKISANGSSCSRSSGP
jgi:simple sugar transport system substrate-binding protein/basic membrane protein A